MVVSGDEISHVTGSAFPLQSVNLNVTKSEPFFGDIGYSLPIPWPSITTFGWWEGGGAYPTQNVLITRRDPEYFAQNDLIRSNGGLPEINPENPIYKFDRSNYTYDVSSILQKQRHQEEKEFRKVARI